MGVNIRTYDYTSFKATVTALGTAGNVFYFSIAAPKYGLAFVSNDANFVVVLDQSAVLPAGFSTDFPAAVQVTNGSATGMGWNGTSSSSVYAA